MSWTCFPDGYLARKVFINLLSVCGITLFVASFIVLFLAWCLGWGNYGTLYSYLTCFMCNYEMNTFDDMSDDLLLKH